MSKTKEPTLCNSCCHPKEDHGGRTNLGECYFVIKSTDRSCDCEKFEV